MSKLLRKDILRWIKWLESGRYDKGKGRLVSHDGKEFCCLGVWADIHGATWAPSRSDFGFLVPVLKGRLQPFIKQGSCDLIPAMAHGLTNDEQGFLTGLNDTHPNWNPVLEYIRKKILPRAK